MPDLSMSLDSLVAHRGLQSRYPENTILALNKAIECGAKYIELDIQFSSDCLPIIYHDANLERVSAHQGHICQYHRHELLKLSAYEPDRLGDSFKTEKIAPLEALVSILEENPQVTAFIELKEESIAHCGRDRMIESAQTLLEPVKQQAVIISYDYLLVQLARETQWPRVGVVLEQWQDIDSEIVRNIASDFIFVDHEIIPQTISPEILSMAPIVAFEVGNSALATELLAKGVSMFETFQLESLMAELANQHRAKTCAI